MRKSKVIGLSAYTKQLRQDLMQQFVTANVQGLIDFAKDEIKKLGDTINTYHSRNHMDRTGNLLNSLCWCVTYGTKDSDKHFGFYREPVIRNMGGNKGSDAYLHEYFPNDMELVDGRKMAEDFTKEYKGKEGKWTMAIAILAPYWGYWEGGFTHVRTGRHMQFQVMTHIYDDVRMGLKPATVHFTNYVPKYSFRRRKYKNRRGYKKIGIIR